MSATQPRKGEGIKLTYDGADRPRYKVRVRVAGGDSGAGQRFANGTFDNLKAARAFRDEVRTVRRKGGVAVAAKTSFRAAAEEWLRRKAASPKVRASTAKSYEPHVHIACAAFGDRPLGKISRADVEELMQRYAASGRSITTARYLLRIVRSVFADAVEEGLITRNPAARVHAQGRPSTARDALTPEEYAAVREQLRTGAETADDWALWQLTLAGLRRGEVMGLRWSDIDLKAATVKIAHSRVTLSGGEEQVGKPKTSRGVRTLNIGAMPELLAALRALREAQLATYGAEQVRTGYLALDPYGEPLRGELWSDRWTRALKAAGVRPLTLHCARHTAVTRARSAGMPDFEVAGWMGHDERVMASTYTHPQAEGQAAVGAALA